MPDVALLKELLDRITLGDERVRGEVEQCKKLLDKISRRTVRVHIEVDYNGREFSWIVHTNNMTAEEWSAKDLRRSVHE